ncbi:MAG: 6,7-dimethyl-8-ribityllumazine synthase [Alphaproteobacteria bacterium]|nr:6,7-dimethyl-8-ribityllumazine synthase [Alphaproteobacteria bacterium]
MNRKSLRVLLIEARFYNDIADELCKGAIRVIQRSSACFDRIAVPGALEIPIALAMASENANYDAYVMLGCVIRGETSHYDIVACESARAVMNLAVSRKLALGNGILTVENANQAYMRARVNGKNKGGFAAQTALDMAELYRQLRN